MMNILVPIAEGLRQVIDDPSPFLRLLGAWLGW